MTNRKRGLGRGLESLLSNEFEDVEETEGASLQDIALDELAPGRYQPRREIDEDALESLAQSIRTQGVVQPLVVRDVGDGYEIVAGERRWRAAKIAGLEAVPAVVRPVADETAMAVALIENIQREDLNPLEEADALQRLIDECGMTHAACAEAVGRSRAMVSNLLRLTELAPEVQQLLRENRINMGHGRALLGAPQDVQAGLAERVVAGGLTVRQTETLVQRALDGSPAQSDQRKRPVHLERAENELADILGTTVAVQSGRGGRARVVIDYKNSAELDALITRLK